MAESKQLEDLELCDLLKLPMRRRFAVLYAESGGKHGAATACAKAAGYAHPESQGSRLLADVKIQEAVRRHARILLRNAGETRDTIVARELRWANSDIRTYFRKVNILDDEGNPRISPSTGQPLSTDEMIPITDWTEDQGKSVKKITWNKDGPVLELMDPVRSNRHLAEYQGMLNQKVSDMTPVEAAQEIHAALAAMDDADGTGDTSTNN